MSLDISSINKSWIYAQNHMQHECASYGYSRPWRRRRWDPDLQVMCLRVRAESKQHEGLGFAPLFFMLLDPELAEDPEEARRINSNNLDRYSFDHGDRQVDDWYPVTVKDDDDFDVVPPSYMDTRWRQRPRQKPFNDAGE